VPQTGFESQLGGCLVNDRLRFIAVQDCKEVREEGFGKPRAAAPSSSSALCSIERALLVLVEVPCGGGTRSN